MIRRVGLIAGREFVDNVRTRGFWLSLLVLPVAILIGLAIPLVAELTRPALDYAVVDRSGWVLEEVTGRSRRADFERLLERWRGRIEQLEEIEDTAPLAELLRARARNEVPIAELAGWLAQRPGAAGEREEGVGLDPELRERLLAWWQPLSRERLRVLVPQAERARFRLVHPPDAFVLEAQAAAWLAGERIFAYAVIPEDPVGGTPGRYVSRNLTNPALRRHLAERVSRVVREQRLAEAGIDPETYAWLRRPWRLETERAVAGARRRADVGDAIEQWGPVAFVYILWVSIFTVTQMLLTNTIEEKSNKLVEVLLASVSPVELMAGKILGIAATGVTIVSTWLATFVLAALVLPTLLGAPAALDLSGLAGNPVYLGSFLLYFVLGYLFYAALLCGVGSVCNTVKEAQNLMIPVQVLLVVPLVLMVPIARDPGGALAQVLTWVPPLTPFIMMNRAADPPALAVYVGTVALMAASIAAALWAAAKVFRVGILLAGSPPRLREILRWIGAPVGPSRAGSR